MKEIENVNELPEECLFFGYGSLMYYHGINGRGLIHFYRSNDELIPTVVPGLKRSMSAEVVVDYYGNKARFYSVSKNKKEKVFGMLFKIHSLYDLKALLRNEGARPVHQYGHYRLFDITSNVKLGKNNKLHVFTLICKELKDKPEIYYPGYVETVYNSIPLKYRKEFLKTGGVYPNDVDHKCIYFGR